MGCCTVVKIGPVRLGRVTVELHRCDDLVSSRVESERQPTAAREQVEDTGHLASAKPGNFLTDDGLIHDGYETW